MEKNIPTSGPESPKARKVLAIRANLEETLQLMELGTEGVQVKEDGTLVLSRKFMTDALKKKKIVNLEQLSPQDLADQFMKVLGEEFLFYTNATGIEADRLPTPAELEKNPIILPNADQQLAA